MSQKSLSRWLRFIVMGIGACGALVYLLFIPVYGGSLANENPEFMDCFWPWLLFLWGSALPCYGALACGWEIAGEVGRDNSFSRKNAKSMKIVAYLAAIDTLYFFVGNVIFMFLGMNHPGIFIPSLIIVFEIGRASCRERV